jgi:beta-glucosidase
MLCLVNIARVPQGGRNFESFGEDPTLAAKLGVSYIKGVQDYGLIAVVKHWSVNNQEENRFLVNVNIDERTQYELYYPAFQAAVEAGVGSVMCAYNLINGTYACENAKSINDDLKGKMGFKGFVMSDWFATHSTVAAANNGLDMEQPGSFYFGEFLDLAIRRHAVHTPRLRDMVTRILTAMYRVGIMDTPQTGNITNDARSKEHNEIARNVSASSTVLLQNNGILPLDEQKHRSIAIVGDVGHAKPIIAGGGSGHVNYDYIVTPLQGITSRAKSSSIKYANSSNPLDFYKTFVSGVDIAIVVVGAYSEEGKDRSSIRLDEKSEQIVSTVVAANPNTIVVVNAPGTMAFPWAKLVPAIVCSFLPGQEDGNALASILYGDVNPSGKLPLTFPIDEHQTYLTTPIQYPGVNYQTNYTEKLLVGYRWFDAAQQTPLFPFGHGLSYTTFAFANLKVNGDRSVSVDIKNSGSRDGAEVAQLYISYPASAGEPPKVLRDFKKVFLKVGQVQTITFNSLSDRDVSVWDVVKSGWSKVSGEFTVHVGSSSRNLPLTGSFTV